MERNVNKDLQELYKVLKLFSIQEFELLITAEFPEVSWDDICSQITTSHLEITSSLLAMKIIGALEETRVTPTEVQDKIAMLKIYKVATHKTIEWQMYEMRNQISSVSLDNMIPRIGRSLKIAMRQQQLRPVVHSYKLDDFLWLSVSTVKISLMKNVNRRKQNPIFFAVQPWSPFIFISSKLQDTNLLQAFVQGLGYETFRDRKLNGRDLHALLQVVDRKRNLPNPAAVLSAPTFTPLPMITGSGIDFTDTHSKEDYLDSVLGKEPPLINTFQVEGRCPMPEETGGHITTTVKLKSDDVAAFVRAMVLGNVMRPDSVLVQLLQGNRNQFVLPD